MKHRALHMDTKPNYVNITSVIRGGSPYNKLYFPHVRSADYSFIALVQRGLYMRITYLPPDFVTEYLKYGKALIIFQEGKY